MSALLKTKASSLAKINALPVFRSPADLYNELTLPFDLQRRQLEGEGTLRDTKYYSNAHHQLARSVAASRKQYRGLLEATAREALARDEYVRWRRYLRHSATQPAARLSQEQKQRIFEAMLIAKERSEERLALSRFIKLGYEYSQAFKVDLPLNPVVIMRLVHPHFGYLNNFPNLNHYKYTHEQLFALIEEFNAVSLLRDNGNTLHSSELLSFVLWKALSLNRPRLTTPSFIDLLKVFKFNDLTNENLSEKLAFSLREGELLSGDDHVRFDLFRQLFVDREL